MTRLYKHGEKVGDYLTAQDMFRVVEEAEQLSVPLRCLCELERYGYSYKKVLRVGA